MKIKSKAWQNRTEWHRWFAWHPIRLPVDCFQDGHWIWLEYVNRKVSYGWDDSSWEYKL